MFCILGEDHEQYRPVDSGGTVWYALILLESGSQSVVKCWRLQLWVWLLEVLAEEISSSEIASKEAPDDSSRFSLKSYHPKLGVSLGIGFDYRTRSWSVAITPHLHEPPTLYVGVPIDANWLGSHHFIKHGWLGNRTKWAFKNSFKWEMHRTKWRIFQPCLITAEVRSSASISPGCPLLTVSCSYDIPKKKTRI